MNVDSKISYKDITLMQMLNVLISEERLPLVYKNGAGRATIPPEKIAQGLFRTIYQKFMQCSESERRSIARSDVEFIHMMKQHIILKMQFVEKGEPITEQLEQEIFKEIWMPTTDIPKIPRGNELLWSAEGDVEPELTEEQKESNKRITEVFYLVWDSIHELYPIEHAKIWPQVRKSRLGINLSHKELTDILLHETGPNFYNVAVHWLTDASVDAIMRTCKNVNKQKKKEMYARVMNATWNSLAQEKVPHA
jgi:hypothetical protein